MRGSCPSPGTISALHPTWSPACQWERCRMKLSGFPSLPALPWGPPSPSIPSNHAEAQSCQTTGSFPGELCSAPGSRRLIRARGDYPGSSGNRSR